MASIANRRLQKELKDLIKSPIPGVELVDCTDLNRWVLKITGAEGTLYAGEVYHLQFTFSSGYPIDSPEVVFLGPSPVHEHIYTVGHICLNVLDKDWSPALKVSSVCLSILSMLSSAQEKKRPHGDAEYSSRAAGRSPKNTRWAFDDDTV